MPGPILAKEEKIAPKKEKEHINIILLKSTCTSPFVN